MPEPPPRRRYPTFFLEGEEWRICEEAAVRARDLASGTATLIHVASGARRTLATGELQAPPVPGLEEIPDEDRYDLRILVEKILELRFSATQADNILALVTRRRMLREPRTP